MEAMTSPWKDARRDAHLAALAPALRLACFRAGCARPGAAAARACRVSDTARLQPRHPAHPVRELLWLPRSGQSEIRAAPGRAGASDATRPFRLNCDHARPGQY